MGAEMRNGPSYSLISSAPKVTSMAPSLTPSPVGHPGRLPQLPALSIFGIQRLLLVRLLDDQFT